MNQITRIVLHVFVGLVTTALGMAFVLAIQALLSVIPAPVAQGVAFHEALIVRPGENTDRIRPQSTELSCYDLNILPIWSELKRDQQFNERLRLSSGRFDCAEMLQVKRLDLNRDGIEEFLVRGKGPVLCGGIGNCGYWIFQLRGRSVNTLLVKVHEADAYEFGVDEVQLPRNHGYPDILLTDRDGQHVLKFRTHRFDGTKYVESQCMAEVPKSLREGAGSMQLVTCDEFYRRGDQMREELSKILE